jgi:hypothetical protein
MLPAQRLGRILGALIGEGRPRTLRGAACKQNRRPKADRDSACGWPRLHVGTGSLHRHQVHADARLCRGCARLRVLHGLWHALWLVQPPSGQRHLP